MIPMTLSSYLLVGAGAFVGAIGRYALSVIGNSRFPSKLPYGTLTVNLTGSFCLGWLIGHDAADSLRLLAGTGFLGAFTTFSTLKQESVRLLQREFWGKWWIYTGLTYAGGIGLAYLGYIW